MVKPAQARQRNQTGLGGRFCLDGPPIWGVFAQRIVNPVLMGITHVITDQAAQMLLIHRDDMIQYLPAATSDPPLRPFRFAKSTGGSSAPASNR